jgi:flavin reductase (DIM6/NTAB) family NADH-FMN oxidoreductase RutF
MSNLQNERKQSEPFDSKGFRSALGSFATGVTIVTSLGKSNQKVGMTANSFNSVSLNPPLVLWSIGKDANCFDDFMASKAFAIHILASDQRELSDRFAMKGGDKFAGLECTQGVSDIPLLPHYSACFQCTLEHQYDGGDHIILVGRVVDFEDQQHPPLLYYRGHYGIKEL